MIRKHLLAILLVLIILFCGADGYIITRHYMHPAQPAYSHTAVYSRVQTD